MDQAYIIGLLAQASADEASRLTARVKCLQLWANLTRQWNHPSTLKAYTTGLQILHTAASAVSSIEAQHARLATEAGYRSGLASDAAALALDQQQLRKAVKMLEQGRGIIFSALGHYQNPLEDLRAANAELANEFGRLSSQMEISVMSGTSKSAVDEVGQ